MSEIRLLTEDELPLYVQIGADAYPGVPRTPEQLLEIYRQNFEDPDIAPWGLFAGDRLLGAFQHFDFAMTVLDQPVTVGGIGGVAVDLFHKKQRVAYRLLQHFVRECRAKGQPMAWLYPFRPDFYRRMGFGYGTKMNYYRLEPAALPRRGSVERTRYAGLAEQEALVACYNRYAAATNGMIRRRAGDFERILGRPEVRCVACWAGEAVRGYVIYHWRATPDNLLSSDLHVRELVYETPDALADILTFLHLQLDQTARVLINTQDEFFTYLVENPLNGSNRFINGAHETNSQGVGLMCRVVDTAGLFRALAAHDFGGQSLRLRLDVIDDFLPENQGETVLHFDQGRVQVVANGDWDVTLRLHVRDFSALITGAVNLRWLVGAGLAQVDDGDSVDRLNRLFAWHQKPICMTGF